MTMTIASDTSVLETRLAEMEQVRSWPGQLLDRFETFIREADDFDLFRIDPLKFARDHGVEEDDAINLFLYATRHGIVRMDWDLRCPTCGGVVGSFVSLSRPVTALSCPLCLTQREAALDEHIKVSFTVLPVIRRIAPHDPSELSLEDTLYRYRIGGGGRIPGGDAFVEAFRKRVKHVTLLEPGVEPIVDLDLQEGTLVVYDLIQEVSNRIPVRSGGRPDASVVFADESVTIEASGLAPGPVCLTLHNKGRGNAAALVFQLPPEHGNVSLEFPRFLSGSRLLSFKTFREQYGREVPPEDMTLGIRDLTVLFSNLHASTDLYEQMGDTQAFLMIRNLFDALGRSVTNHHGAVVKTVGDSVMAAFAHPIDALEAGYDMLREIEALNEILGKEALALKIGIHRGPAVAVTLNDRLDYFGHSVNVAARVQAIASAGDLCMTSDVWAGPGVKDRCQNRVYNKFEAHVKGVNRPINIYVLRLVM